MTAVLEPGENEQNSSSTNIEDGANCNRIPTRCRTVLWYMTFTGFALDSIIRMNLSIAIVDMVMSRNDANTEADFYGLYSTDCMKQDTFVYTTATILPENSSSLSDRLSFVSYNITVLDQKEYPFSIERIIFDALKINYDKMGFNWNEYEQNLVLGSYYWLHWLTQIPGGVLSRSIGTKKVFGTGLLISCLLCALTPTLAFFNLWLLISLRVVQGMLGAITWPAMHNIVAQWIPPNERSKFLTNAMGFSVGIGLFYPLFGYIIVLLSWEWTFHLVSVIGIIWFILWQYYVFDSPNQHPSIDAKEKDYILKALGGSFSHHQTIKTPWKAILLSLPVWMNILVQFGNMWSIMTLIAQTPTYLNEIIGFDIGNAGLLSGIPHLLRVVFAYFYSMYSDHLLRSKKISRTNVRKLATFVTSILSGIFVILFAYSECYIVPAIILLTLSITVTGALPAGPLASMVDLSPNFAGAVTGLIGTISILPGFISPYIVGILTYENQTIQQWQYVFLILAGWVLSTGTLYLFLSSSKLQKWNNIENSKNI